VTGNLFLGIDARTPELIALLEELRADASLRVPRDDGLHLTLRFFGRAHAAAAIEGALAGFEHAPLGVELAGLGTFGDRTLWVGARNEDEVRMLGLMVDAALVPLGDDGERAFEPHVTVARARGRADLRARAKAAVGRGFGRVVARELLLYESVAEKRGPNRYVPIARFPLA